MTYPDRLLPAAPVKLRSGAWGARVEDPGVAVGDLLRVESKRGDVWEALVVSVIKTDDDGALVRTVKPRPPVERCYLCRPTARRTVEVGEHCDHCGATPIYREPPWR